MAVRLKDIAQDLGLSTMTISKVLRGKSDVGEATRQRVLKRVQELKYRPNLLAQGLANGQTQTAGLIVPDLVQPFFAEFAKSLASHLRGKEYGLLLASSEDSPELEAEEFQTLLLRGVDVVILATCRGLRSSARDLLHGSAPCVLVDRQLERAKLPMLGLMTCWQASLRPST